MTFATRRLEARVGSWAAKGLITREQAESIMKDVRRESEASRIAPFTVLASLGGLCVALGIILLVAYNWADIHRGIKLGGFLVLLAAAGELVARLPETRRVGGAAARLLWLFLPLAGIGLWAQVYQLSGDPFRPLAFWLALSTPLAWFSRDPVVAVVYAGGLVVAIFTGTFNADAAVSLVSGGTARGQAWQSEAAGLLRAFGAPLAGLAVLWGWAAAVGKWRLSPMARVWLVVAALVWAWALAVGDTVLEVHDIRVQFLICASLAAVFWGVRDLAGLPAGPSAEVGFDAIAVLLYLMTFFWHSSGGRAVVELPPAVYAAVLAVAGCVLAIRSRGFAGGAAADWWLRVLVLLPMVLSVVMVFRGWYKPVAVAANLGLVALCVWSMADGVHRAATPRINLGIAIMGILILTRFLDYFGTMAQSGVAFIAIGVAFIGVAWALNRGRLELLSRAGVGR